MEKKKVKLNNFDDQILKLPDNLVESILSRLPLKDLVRTSILSKKWEKVWVTAFTKLRFDYQFLQGLNYSFNKNEEEMIVKFEELISFVERTLRIRVRHKEKVSMKKMVLYLAFYNTKTVTFLNRCIGYGIGCNVKKLEIEIEKSSNKVIYNLPRTVLVAKSITELGLIGCKLGSSSCANMNMPCLKTLGLRRVCIDVQTIQNVLANSPVIEKLTVSGCSTLKGTLQIFGHVNPKLVEVDMSLCGFERVEIEATGLKIFIFHESWRPPCEINVSVCKNMKKLELYRATITDKIFHDHLSELCLLETLILVDCNMLETIKITSCRLKELVVRSCMKLVKFDIDDLNLTSFAYDGVNVISFSSNALALSIVDICLYPQNVNSIWYVNLIEFLGQLNNSKVLKLHSQSDEDVFVPKELREFLLPPLYNVEHLTLELDREVLSQAFEEIVDGFFWFSPRLATLSIASYVFYEKKIVRSKLWFFYETMNSDENICCCCSLPVTCWRHCLKEVKIVTSRELTLEERKNIKSFFEQSKILKKVDFLAI